MEWAFLPPSGIQIGCLDLVYRYGDMAAYPWEGHRFSAPVKTIELGLYQAEAGQPHFHNDLPPDAADFIIGGKKYVAPLLSLQQRAQINAMPYPSAEKIFEANLDACFDVVAVLMAMTYPEIDRMFLENNLTLPEMNNVLKAFHLLSFGGWRSKDAATFNELCIQRRPSTPGPSPQFRATSTKDWIWHTRNIADDVYNQDHSLVR